MRKYLLAAAVFALTYLVSGTAIAQNPFPGRSAGPYRAPAWSPYLNLFRRGHSPAFNYFSLVKPELDFRNQFQQVERQFGNVQQNIQSLDQQKQQASALPPTGHPVGFMTHTRYFMTLGSGASPTGAGISAPTNSSRFGQRASTNRPTSSSLSSASRFAAPSTNARGR